MADSNRSMELQMDNTTTENFTITDFMINSEDSKWMAGEEPIMGKTVPAGASATWGVVTTRADGSVEANVLLQGSKGSLIGFKFKNLSTNRSLVLVQLSPNVIYDIKPIAAAKQAQVKAQVIVSPA